MGVNCSLQAIRHTQSMCIVILLFNVIKSCTVGFSKYDPFNIGH